MKRAILVLAACAATFSPVAAEDTPRPDAEKLIARLRVTYSQPTSFSPAAMRYPLRRDAAAEYAAARTAADDAPADLNLRIAAALAGETAEVAEAQAQWQRALALVEGELRSCKPDRDKKKGAPAPDSQLLERHVQALVGADVPIRAVPAAERLLAAEPQRWRTHLLAGDAFLRRADFNWRVLVRKAAGTKMVSGPELIQMNADLERCSGEYDQAVRLAPAELAPRAARISLRLASPLMASFLPKGAVKAPETPDLAGIRADLLEAVAQNPGRVAPVWHALYFFSAVSGGETSLSAAERSDLEKGLGSVQATGDEVLFLEEARGLLSLLKNDYPAARAAFEKALSLAPDRGFAAEWLGVAEANTPEAKAEVLARVRKRLETAPRTQDWALLGILTADEDRTAAVEALRQALKLDVQNVNARYNLAILLLQKNPESVEAMHHLTRTVELRGDDREARFAYAAALALSGEYREAQRSLEALLRLFELDDKLRARITATLAELPAAPKPEMLSGSKAPATSSGQ